ncbi:uncharacterized protein LOC128392783 [Panonychus citri]|uniref:uncharacterized protein LOC128392783 n=1 Tax=Panonychus citri TaxID=50023 RepID=UPI002307F12C|nr:uncharacterized protein LOC128392783 [Panonychus citri]
MSQEIPSILSCSLYQQVKKKKRISFSQNMVFQELYEDGTTRTYHEKIADELTPSLDEMMVTLEESDSVHNTTLYDFNMVISSPSPSPSPSPSQSTSPIISPTTSPTTSLISLSDSGSTEQSSCASIEFSRKDYSTFESRYDDSILFYVDKKSTLELSSEEEVSQQIEHNSTFVGSLFVDDVSMVEDESTSGDDVFNFIDNSIFTKVPEANIDLSLIDPRFHKFVVILDHDGAVLKFMNGNFLIHLKYSVSNIDTAEVKLEDITIESCIDKKINSQGLAQLSEYSVHHLTKSDDKLIRLIKKTVAIKFDQFKKQKGTTTALLTTIINDLQKIFHQIVALFVDLLNVCRFHEWKIINANIANFEISFEIKGLRYSLWLILCFDLLNYPNDTIKVKFGIHKADLKLYPYHLFHKKIRSVPSGSYKYIGQIVETAKKFIFDWRSGHKSKAIRLSIRQLIKVY